MKLQLILTIALLAPLPAIAGDNESPIKGKGATAINRGHTTEEINRALVFLGRPEHEQIGRSRVLHDDNAGVTRSTMTIRFQ